METQEIPVTVDPDDIEDLEAFKFIAKRLAGIIPEQDSRRDSLEEKGFLQRYIERRRIAGLEQDRQEDLDRQLFGIKLVAQQVLAEDPEQDRYSKELWTKMANRLVEQADVAVDSGDFDMARDLLLQVGIVGAVGYSSSEDVSIQLQDRNLGAFYAEILATSNLTVKGRDYFDEEQPIPLAQKQCLSVIMYGHPSAETLLTVLNNKEVFMPDEQDMWILYERLIKTGDSEAVRLRSEQALSDKERIFNQIALDLVNTDETELQQMVHEQKLIELLEKETQKPISESGSTLEGSVKLLVAHKRFAALNEVLTLVDERYEVGQILQFLKDNELDVSKSHFALNSDLRLSEREMIGLLEIVSRSVEDDSRHTYSYTSPLFEIQWSFELIGLIRESGSLAVLEKALQDPKLSMNLLENFYKLQPIFTKLMEELPEQAFIDKINELGLPLGVISSEQILKLGRAEIAKYMVQKSLELDPSDTLKALSYYHDILDEEYIRNFYESLDLDKLQIKWEPYGPNANTLTGLRQLNKTMLELINYYEQNGDNEGLQIVQQKVVEAMLKGMQGYIADLEKQIPLDALKKLLDIEDSEVVVNVFMRDSLDHFIDFAQNNPDEYAFFQQYPLLLRSFSYASFDRQRINTDYLRNVLVNPEAVELLNQHEWLQYQIFKSGGALNFEQIMELSQQLGSDSIILSSERIYRAFRDVAEQSNLDIQTLSGDFEAFLRVGDIPTIEELQDFIASREQYKDKLEGYDEAFVNNLIFDLTFYNNTSQQLHSQILERFLADLEPAQAEAAISYLRWLDESELRADITPAELQDVFFTKLDRLRSSFTELLTDQSFFESDKGIFLPLIEMLEDINKVTEIPFRNVKIGKFKIPIPEGFAAEYNRIRKENPDAQFIPELAIYLTRLVTQNSNAYVIDNLIRLQIADLADSTNRRQTYTTSEGFLSSLEQSVDASERTWDFVSEYQRISGRPVFLIANERTGPSDVASEFFDGSVAEQLGINQSVNLDALLSSFEEHQIAIHNLYDRFLRGEDVSAEVREVLGADVVDMLDLSGSKVIPISRIKVPSSIGSVSENVHPEGMEQVMDFFKLITMLGGSIAVMDESTRSAPRSLELLYATLQRKGGVSVVLNDKLSGATGQTNTVLNPITSDGPMQVALIDPWPVESEKPFPDDTRGLVPEIADNKPAGVVEFSTPSWLAVTPEGFSTIQKIWMMMVARGVSSRLQSK